MDFDDDDDDEYKLEWNSSDNERSSPKKGRRAVNDKPDESFVSSNEVDSDITTNQGEAPTKPPRRKTGGWADAPAKGSKGKRASLSYEEEIASESTEKEKDITTIPDLDDFQEEDFAAEVAKAPNIAINRVATYKELDIDLLKHSSFGTLDDIDLKALTRFLSTESEIREEDVPWTWDTLLADVSSKLVLESDVPEAQ